ncbi:MAG: hypothetical protein ACRC7G_02950, partial [Beijerinckiaceae bacterium]
MQKTVMIMTAACALWLSPVNELLANPTGSGGQLPPRPTSPGGGGQGGANPGGGVPRAPIVMPNAGPGAGGPAGPGG